MSIKAVNPTRPADPATNAAAKTAADKQLARELSKEEYYHGLLPREDMISLLRHNGEFLVRYSEARKGEKSFILSMMYKEHLEKDGIKHFIINRTKFNKFVIESFGFESVQEMIKFHMAPGKPLTTKDKDVFIVTPIKRQSWEHAHEDITIGKKLGEGAFGEVSLGTLKMRRSSSRGTSTPGAQNPLNSGKNEIPVAIKLAKMETVTKEQIKEIMAEARLMRRFDHPNVVKFYGVATLQEPLMVLMEVCREGALDSYLKKTHQTVEKLVEMSIQAAWGLDYIHRSNVIHRDIAARNCLYGNNNVKIADFGLSREGTSFQMDPHQGRVPIKWLAPEILDTALFTQKTDVWAYGIMVWEIFMNGEQPYPGMAVAAVLPQVRNGYRMDVPPNMRPEISQYLVGSIWNGLPDARPSMAEIVAHWAAIFPKVTPPSGYRSAVNIKRA